MIWYAYAVGSGGVVAAAFSKTINLGAVLVAVIIIIGFAWASRQDKRSERWEKLYQLADTERKEVQQKLDEVQRKFDESLETISEYKEVISQLEALQMPTRVMEVMTQAVKELNEQAAFRQEQIRMDIKDHIDRHEEAAIARSQLFIGNQSQLVDVLTALSRKLDIPPPF